MSNQVFKQNLDDKQGPQPGGPYLIQMLMSNQVFKQNLDDKQGPQPGGPYLIQMLFKEPVEMPDKEKMTAVMEKHIGSTECFCYDKKMAGFAALDHIAEFQDGKCPVQLMVMKCDKFKGKGFDAFLMSQMWDCQEDRERIFQECRYQVVATDMLAAALPALERANLDADFLDALAELYPTCEAFYFQNCGKLLLAEYVRSHQIEGSDDEPDVGLSGGPGADLPGVSVSGGGHRYAGRGASGSGAGQPGCRLFGCSGGAVPHL